MFWSYDEVVRHKGMTGHALYETREKKEPTNRE